MDLFKLGGQCGLKPNEVLDISLEVFQAYVDGYTDHMFDEQLMTVHTGFWAGYYANSKHPKSVKSIITSLQNKREHDKQGSAHVDTVDVDAFLAMEAKFNAMMQR